jgi:hypothetical protein
MLKNYLEMGVPNPFLIGPQTEWCDICRQKYQNTKHTPFCELFKSMGNDVNNC